MPLDKIKEEWWQTTGPYQVRQLAQHYGVFEHLFGDAFFTPRVSLDISYPLEDGKMAPVCYGNVLKPGEVSGPYNGATINCFNLPLKPTSIVKMLKTLHFSSFLSCSFKLFFCAM